MAHQRFLLSIVLAAVLPFVAHAKGNTRDWSNVVALDVDTRISVKLITGQVLVGYPSKVTNDALTVAVSLESAVLPTGSTNLSRTVARSEIKEIRKARASRLKSGLVGAAIGAGVGAAIGGIAEAKGGDYDDKGVLTVYLAGAGAQIGALTGAINPFSFLKGKKIYEAP